MHNRVTTDFYTCEVIGGSVDPDHRGAVRVKVLGVTDTYSDEDQPFVYPALASGIQQVPQKGYFLRVQFTDGDINQGKYYGMSATPSVLPSQYVTSYPDVAVGNLGEDNYFYVHDRKTHISTITNPGNQSKVTWDAAGYVTMECDTAYSNTGMGANEGTGTKEQQVLTEGTIDIFTCMPVGNARNRTGIGQGSEYLAVSHISQATVDAFHGTGIMPTTTAPTPSDPETDSDVQMRDIVDSNEKKVDDIIFYPGQYIPRADKTYTHIILCHSQGECFPKQAAKSINTNSSVHYLIGDADGIPDILGDQGDAGPGGVFAIAPTNFGAAQFIEIKDDAGMFGGAKYLGEKANRGAVIIMVTGNSLSPYTDYQKTMINKLIVHIRTISGESELPVITPDDFDSLPTFDSTMITHIL